MTSSPLLSVVMAVHNGAAYLRQTLDSLRIQTFKDFELIVIDDGSSDETPEILDACRDLSLVRLRNSVSMGLAFSLNRGIDVARGVYIARLDADDLAYPERFSTQISCMDANPDIILLGTAYDVIDARSVIIETQRHPAQDAPIRWQMLFHNAFCHSSVVLRRQLLDQPSLRYDANLPFAQDFDLWSRLLKHGTGANLQVPLVALRQHEGSISAGGKAAQQSIADQIAVRNISELLGFSPDPHHVRLLRSLYYGLPVSLSCDDQMALKLIPGLLRAFGRCGQEDVWTERLLRHRDLPLWPLVMMLFPLAPGSVLKSVIKRLFGSTAAQPDRVRTLY